jgi:uncharacterized protein (TIGR00661 family)
MKILYAVQATGNGHISRAHQLYPYLKEIGEVDIMLSGSNSTLDLSLPIKYRSKGLSLFYSTCGGLDYLKTISSINFLKVRKEAKDLPVENYDLIINDFDYVTASACASKNVPSVQFGHQASFMSAHTPRPLDRSLIGEMILKNYAPAQKYVGLHFQKYDDFIYPPIIKSEIINAKPSDNGHITVYLPAYEHHCIERVFKESSHVKYHWFSKDVIVPFEDGNITYFPINQNYFNESLIHCHGLLTGGGFETPAEALYLKKKLLTIPIKGQYEQQCNAAALEKLNVPKLDVLNQKTKSFFFKWLDSQSTSPKIDANDIKTTLEKVMETDNVEIALRS